MNRIGAADQRPVTGVAVGVLIRSDGSVLLADRPAGKPYAGYWEFPGGKIEEGESVAQTLARELREELDVHVGRSDPWVVMEYDYPHAYVRLHFRRIFDWAGSPRPVEGQRLQFLAPGAVAPAPLLPAAVPALRWIQLPTVSAHSPGTLDDVASAGAWLDGALARGLRQIVWHEPRLNDTQLALALTEALVRARAYGARLLVDARSAHRLKAGMALPPDLYLCAADLRAAHMRPPADWLGAGVSSRADIERAALLGCDFAVVETDAAQQDDGACAPPSGIGPCGDSPLPLFLTRRLSLLALDRARRAGAHGLALRALP